MYDIATIITIVGGALAVASFYLGRQTAFKQEGKEAGSVAKDIEYIKESVERIDSRLNDDVKRLEGRIDEISKQMTEVAGTAGRAHESAKIVHNRLNEHLEREHKMNIIKTREDEQ